MAEILKFHAAADDMNRLRNIEFTKSWTLYDNVVDMAHDYGQEIIDSINEWQRGELDPRKLSTLIMRAQYACYEKGLADAYKQAQETRIQGLNAKQEAKRRERQGELNS